MLYTQKLSNILISNEAHQFFPKLSSLYCIEKVIQVFELYNIKQLNEVHDLGSSLLVRQNFSLEYFLDYRVIFAWNCLLVFNKSLINKIIKKTGYIPKITFEKQLLYNHPNRKKKQKIIQQGALWLPFSSFQSPLSYVIKEKVPQ